MTIKEFKIFFCWELAKIHPKTEIESFFYLLMEHELKLDRISTVLQADKTISNTNINYLQNALYRLKKEEPIQYILEKTTFYGLPFRVNKHVLIPRPETEELVNWVLEEVEEKTPLTILDIGTGSGCISIAIKKQLPNATVFALDISSNALHIAQQNANSNNVVITFMQQNILTTTQLPRKFDVIISNPPYVRESEKQEIKNNVLQNEPHTALFVSDENPLLFYSKIADLAKNHLVKNGLLFFEINQYLAKETRKLLNKKGFKNVELKKDLFKNDRMLKTKF